MKRFADYLCAAAVVALVAAIAIPQLVLATGLTAATYAKKSDIVVKAEGGASMHLVEFTVTGGSGDTYLTGGVSPSASATGLGYTGWKILECEPDSVAWTAYTTTAHAVVLRSVNVQLANATSLNGKVLTCRGLAYE